MHKTFTKKSSLPRTRKRKTALGLTSGQPSPLLQTFRNFTQGSVQCKKINYPKKSFEGLRTDFPPADINAIELVLPFCSLKILMTNRQEWYPLFLQAMTFQNISCIIALIVNKQTQQKKGLTFAYILKLRYFSKKTQNIKSKLQLA